MLGSLFDIGDVFESMFDVGDVFGSASDVNKPTVCLHIKCGDVLESVFYVDVWFGNAFNFGEVLGSPFVISDVNGLHIKILPYV
jgi:hypothetical protein